MKDCSLQGKLERMLGDDETVRLAGGFEEAFLGIGRQFGKPIAVYDRAKCIDILQRDMSEEEAEEYFQYNVEGAYVGEQTPIFAEWGLEDKEGAE